MVPTVPPTNTPSGPPNTAPAAAPAAKPAIAPPPIAGVTGEAYEVRLESKQALVALEASQARAHAHGSAMPQPAWSRRLSSFAGMAMLGALAVAAVLAVSKLTLRRR